MSGHTKGPWGFSEFHGTEERNKEAIALGLKPVPNVNNEGQRFIMAGIGDDRKRIALVDCQTEFKRGKGHETECAERDANARLIAAAPDLLEALQYARRFVKDCDTAYIDAAIRKATGES
jgi:hypothetical protein